MIGMNMDLFNHIYVYKISHPKSGFDMTPLSGVLTYQHHLSPFHVISSGERNLQSQITS